MRNKIATMLFVVASFAALAHTRLEAVSAVPNQLCIGVTIGSINTTILSTNTLSASIDGDVGTSGSDEQLIGYVEFNVTKSISNTQSFKIAQNEPQPSAGEIPANNNWPLFLIGQTATSSTSDYLIKWQALKLYSNISQTDTTSAFVTVNPQPVLNFSGQAVLKAGSVSAYTMSGQIGILSCYAVDDSNNYNGDGTYEGTFVFIFAA